MQASSALISCVGSAIQTSLTIVFLLVARHNSNKFDSVFAPASVDYSRLLAKLFVNTHQASQVSFFFLLSAHPLIRSLCPPETGSFVVNGNGDVKEVKVVRSPDKELSKEVVRVVKAMPKWNPARQIHNDKVLKTINASFTLPIFFRLPQTVK